MKKLSLLAIAGAIALLSAPSFAQDKMTMTAVAPPTRMRAVVEKFDNGVATIKTEKGETAMVAVGPKTNISGVAARQLSDIKADDFVGITALADKDGKMNATEVHIFPPAMRGAGEGHYPWDKGPSSSMTNAAVSGMVKSADGETFTMSYKDKMSGSTKDVKIDVSPTIPIVMFVPGDQNLLKPGAHVVMFARKGTDGNYMAVAVVAEKDGVKPPM